MKNAYIITLFFLFIFLISAYSYEGLWGQNQLLDNLRVIAYFFIFIVFISLTALFYESEEGKEPPKTTS